MRKKKSNNNEHPSRFINHQGVYLIQREIPACKGGGVYRSCLELKSGYEKKEGDTLIKQIIQAFYNIVSRKTG